MQSTILVPLDGSPLAEHALPYAERLARATSAHLILCRALSATKLQPEQIVAAVGDARAYVQGVADQLAGRGSIVETTIPWGEPGDEILEQVRSARADLVVMATHGRSGLGRWLYGSVADEVLRRASVPMFLVPPGSDEPWSDHHAPRILCTARWLSARRSGTRARPGMGHTTRVRDCTGPGDSLPTLLIVRGLERLRCRT
jgi:nucleotide-binding universal stress UspA family protein